MKTTTILEGIKEILSNLTGFITTGPPSTTVSVTSADAANTLADSIVYKDGNSSNTSEKNKASYAVVTVESNSIRYALGGTAPNRTGPLGHKVDAKDVVKLESFEEISTFSYINATSGANGELQITVYYE